jgi:hypothetical protein
MDWQRETKILEDKQRVRYQNRKIESLRENVDSETERLAEREKEFERETDGR